MTVKDRKQNLGVNPFSVSLEIVINKGVEDGVYKYDGEHYLPNEIEYEDSIYTRIYTDKTLREITNTLSSVSCKIYLWIIHAIYKQEDYIFIDRKRIMEELQIKSVNTLKKSYDELTRYGFITPSREKDIWWINPMYFFKGNRVIKFPKCVKVKRDYR